MSGQIDIVLDDLANAEDRARAAQGAFADAVGERASRMRATGVRVQVRQSESGVAVQFSSTGRRGYAPATVADKAVKRLVETGQEALSEATS